MTEPAKVNAKAAKVSEYSRPGPHMWRLLFEERTYVPLPKS
jgi:hypothetical protein